jgi:hypothetical protein
LKPALLITLTVLAIEELSVEKVEESLAPNNNLVSATGVIGPAGVNAAVYNAVPLTM